MKEIQLQKFDDTFQDYYDSEEDCFVVFAGTLGVKDMMIPTDVKIKDYDGLVWDCYLTNAEYSTRFDMYEIKYKKY